MGSSQDARAKHPSSEWAKRKEEIMGPLQYMVVSFEARYFARAIIPELHALSEKQVIRVIDLVVVKRNARGTVSSSELADLLPDKAELISSTFDPEDSWFAQDDIDLVGESLPNGSSVALLLFEHLWASRLDESVRRANGSLAKEPASRAVASEIERMLTLGV
jgi:hypothetical protein